MFRLLFVELALASTPNRGAAPVTGDPVHPRDRFDGLIANYSAHSRLDPRMVKALIAAESDFQPRAVSPSGAVGLMQLMPRTAEMAGVDRSRLEDPDDNLRAGTAYLQELFLAARARYHLSATRLDQAPPWVQQRVLAAYHAGPRNLFRDRWPRPTRAYVRRVWKLSKARFSRLSRSALP